MDKEIKLKLAQLVSDTKSRLFGEKAKIEIYKLLTYENAIDYFIDLINELYNPLEKDIELYKIGQQICECILILYRDSKLKNTNVSQSLFL